MASHTEMDVTAVETALHGAADSVEALVGQLNNHAHEATGQLVSGLTDAMDALRRQAADVAGKAAHEVKEHPAIALASAVAAIAAVAGLIVVANGAGRPSAQPDAPRIAE